MNSYTDQEKIAFIRTLHVAAMSDGKYHTKEVQYINYATNVLEMNNDLRDRINNMLSEEAFKIITCMTRIKKVELIQCVRDMVLIDDEFDTKEKEFIIALMRLMGLTPDDLKG
jgi:uncharacterized tellurite resistance protein B-like protein